MSHIENIQSKLALQHATMSAAQSKLHRACSDCDAAIQQAKATKARLTAEARDEFDTAQAAYQALKKQQSLQKAKREMAQIWSKLEAGAAQEAQRAADEKLPYHTAAELAAS